MSVQLNHTIVHARDKQRSAHFLVEILGLPPPKPFAHFLVVELGNGVSLDFIEDKDNPIHREHYAFLVSDQEWDEIFGRIRARGLPYWADPRAQRPNEYNTHFGGRGLYWQDPDGHYLEIITRPYEM